MAGTATGGRSATHMFFLIGFRNRLVVLLN